MFRNLVLALSFAPVTATAGELLEFTPQCEAALALSAGPATLRDGAGILLLGSDGYELHRQSTNGFTCLVERNHPQSVIPQCFDAPGTEAHVPLIEEGGRLLRAGHSFEEIAGIRSERLADPAVARVTRPGLVYMVSDYNYIHVAGRDRLLKVGPHVMFHAPDMADEQIGSNAQAAIANRGLPFITAKGPHGFMTSFVERPSDSSEVERHCAGQLPDRTAMLPFPPSPEAAARTETPRPPGKD